RRPLPWPSIASPRLLWSVASGHNRFWKHQPVAPAPGLVILHRGAGATGWCGRLSKPTETVGSVTYNKPFGKYSAKNPLEHVMGRFSPGGLVERPTHVRFGVLGFACSLSLLTYLDRVCISRVKGEIRTDLGLGAVEMGIVLSAFVVGYAIFEVPGGWMGDRWGSRRVITRIVLWWSLFTALTGCVWRCAWDSGHEISILGTSVTLGFASCALVLVRFLFGCGEAGAYPNLARVTGIWFPFRERAFAQGTVWMCARLGGAVAPVVIGWLTVQF